MGGVSREKDPSTTVALSNKQMWVPGIGNEDLEWRLHITITGYKQTIELTPQNAYTRSKSF